MDARDQADVAVVKHLRVVQLHGSKRQQGWPTTARRIYNTKTFPKIPRRQTLTIKSRPEGPSQAQRSPRQHERRQRLPNSGCNTRTHENDETHTTKQNSPEPEHATRCTSIIFQRSGSIHKTHCKPENRLSQSQGYHGSDGPKCNGVKPPAGTCESKTFSTSSWIMLKRSHSYRSLTISSVLSFFN